MVMPLRTISDRWRSKDLGENIMWPIMDAQPRYTASLSLHSISIVQRLVSYDNNGADTNLNAMKLRQVKNLCAFLIDRNNQQESLDRSTFTYDEVIAFVTLGGNITRPAQTVVPARVDTAKQVQLDLSTALVQLELAAVARTLSTSDFSSAMLSWMTTLLSQRDSCRF